MQASQQTRPGAGRRRAGPGILVALLALGLAAGPASTARGAAAEGTEEGADPAGSAAEPAFPRPAMQEILEALAFLLPRSTDPARFAARDERERTLAALRTLAGAAGALEAHTGRGEAFRHLGTSLAMDAREAARRYEAGRHREAGFLLQRLTENCIACHARLPGSGDSGLGRELVGRMDTQGLSPPERARLQVATRRFDDALETYEALFASPRITPAQLDLMGYLADYLTVVLRVEDDPDRALATLRRLAAREEVPEWLARDLEAWTAALEELRGDGLGAGEGSLLERARGLLGRAEALREEPADHTGLIHDLVASSLLYRYTERRPPPEAASGRELAEAYYLLGVAESRIDRSYWLSPADLYLETAIRMAPHAPFAREAYELLEERTVFGYTGSSGTHVPEDVQRKLDELRELVEAGPV